MVWREEIVLKYFDVSRGEAISSLRGVGGGGIGGRSGKLGQNTVGQFDTYFSL